MREERREGRLPHSPARATRGLRRSSLDARSESITVALVIFVIRRLGGKVREAWFGLPAHGTPTMKRWSFDVRRRDQARLPREYDSEANRE